MYAGSAEQLAGRTLFSTHWIAIGLSSPAGQDSRGRVGESLSFYSCLRMPLMEGKEKEEECEITGVWDCGSPLYDSFELVSLSQLLDRNMMGMAMPGSSGSGGKDPSSSEAGDSISTTSMKVDLAGCTGIFKTDTGDPAKRRRRRRDEFKNKIRVGSGIDLPILIFECVVVVYTCPYIPTRHGQVIRNLVEEMTVYLVGGIKDSLLAGKWWLVAALTSGADIWTEHAPHRKWRMRPVTHFQIETSLLRAQRERFRINPSIQQPAGSDGTSTQKGWGACCILGKQSLKLGGKSLEMLLVRLFFLEEVTLLELRDDVPYLGWPKTRER
ncbi:hypothetical protein ACLOJK_010110 [Asimina triloba]